VQTSAYLTRAFGEMMKFCVKIVWMFFMLNASVLAQSKAQTISFAAAPAIAVGGTGYQLQKVNKVSVSGSTINVTTSPAALSDALKQATVSNNMQLFDVSSAKSNASVANKVQAQSLIAANGSRTSQVSWDNAYLTGQQIDHAYQAPQLGDFRKLIYPLDGSNQDVPFG